MKAVALSILALGAMSVAASAEPAKLGKDQLSSITAAAKRTGFATESTTTQGSGGKTNLKANPSNEGTTTVTTTGPSGALKNDKTTPNQTTSTNLPGKKR